MLRLMLTWFILFSTTYIVLGQHILLENQQASNSECFGSDNVVECVCDTSSHILLDKIYLGSKLLTTDCPSSWNATLNISDTCCENSPDDCLYTADKNNYEPLLGQCNGLVSCQSAAYNDVISSEKCDSANISQFLQNTNYMYLDYFCIEDDRAFAIGDGNVTAMRTNTTVYAWNAQSLSSETSLTFSIQSSDPIDTFLLYRITLDIPCNTTVHVTDIQRSEVANWTCEDNSYTMEVLNISSSYLEVELLNEDSLEDARFWFGFRASSNITITYPVPEMTTTQVTQPPADMSTDSYNTSTTTNPDGTENYLRNIILSISIPFVVIFCVLVVITLCVMHHRQDNESVREERRISDEMEKYFVVSTEYTTVKTGPVLDEAPAELPEAPSACRYDDGMETSNHDQETTTQKKVEMTTEI